MSSDLDFDSDLEFLNNDDEYQKIIQQRKNELKAEYDRLADLKANGYMEYVEISNEKELMDTIKSISIRFVKVNVEALPWLSKKINLKVLPTLIVYSKGKVFEKLVGFDELGNSDQFETSSLEKWFNKIGIIG
ncbi:hypothetical protein BB560_004065 [Smittium megazygosporum]|uniref:Thioredoxin domain-containing protein n=1 Tax=Smittium megazygosporum TaxID=133381 RepID=A0A2T9ZAB6_9FUNG|nr:hypothetical protein BB560_004065 [Smittium megazygosporum]